MGEAVQMKLLIVTLPLVTYPSQINDLEIFIAFDKPWDEDFQDILVLRSRRPVFTWSHLQVVGFM